MRSLQNNSNNYNCTINIMNRLWAGCFPCFFAFNSDHKPRRWPLLFPFSVGKVKNREIVLPKVTELVNGKSGIWTWEFFAKACAGSLLLCQVKPLSLDQSQDIHLSLSQRSQTFFKAIFPGEEKQDINWAVNFALGGWNSKENSVFGVQCWWPWTLRPLLGIS